MGTTGLIYAAIVAAWAAYLVPLWLRRHDEVSRQKSLERYSSAMRVLSREPDGGRYVARRRDEPPRVLAPSPKRSAAQFRARRAAAMRRRRVLSLLMLTWASVGALAVFETVPRWAAGVPAVLILTFLVLVRRTVRRARKMLPAPAPARKAQRLDVSYTYGSSVAEPEPTVEVKTSTSSSADETAASEEGLWDPVPVTLPIYVYKEKAPSRTVRTISLPGTEFASPVETPQAPAEPEPAAPPAPPRPSMEDLDEPTQIARAVGD
jgi:hypothetical protein